MTLSSFPAGLCRLGKAQISIDNIVFLDWDELITIHQDQLERYGGQDGFIDEGVVRSAMARPQFSAQYNRIWI